MIHFSLIAAPGKYQENFDSHFSQLPCYEQADEKLAAVLIELMLFSSSDSKIGTQLQKIISTPTNNLDWKSFWKKVKRISKPQLVDQLWADHIRYEQELSTNFRLEFWVFANEHVIVRSLSDLYTKLNQASPDEFDTRLRNLIYLQTMVYGLDMMKFVNTIEYKNFHSKKAKEISKKLSSKNINIILQKLSEDIYLSEEYIENNNSMKNLFKIVLRNLPPNS